MRSRLAAAAFCLAALATLSGCGPSMAVVSGEMINNPNKAEPGEKWTVSLTPDGSGQAASLEVDANGKFSQSLPHGTYTLTVTHYPATSAENKPIDPKKGPQIPSTKAYPDKWTVPGGPYTLDLSKLPKK